MEFLSILMDIHIHLDPKPLPCHFRSDPASAFTLASKLLSGLDRPPLWGRNNKIIPTLTIILPRSASSTASSAFVFSHPSNLTCVHASISDLLLIWPSPPAPKEEEATLGGHWSALHIGSTWLQTLVVNTSRVCLVLSDSKTGQCTNFSITTSPAFTS